MGVFEMVVAIVVVSTLGKVVMTWQDRRASRGATRPEEIGQLHDALGEVSARVSKLEEERDFYRALLESPDRDAVRRLPPEDGPPGG